MYQGSSTKQCLICHKELNQQQINDNIKLEEITQKFNNALTENSFSSKEKLEKALLPKELREELSMKCKALEEKCTQIQTLKIDTAKKLSEQKGSGRRFLETGGRADLCASGT